MTLIFPLIFCFDSHCAFNTLIQHVMKPIFILCGHMIKHAGAFFSVNLEYKKLICIILDQVIDYGLKLKLFYLISILIHIFSNIGLAIF